MADESPHLTPAETGDFVLATYREIAEHFGLSGPNAARTKVKRAGWGWDPPNHPADPLHIKVPRDAWSQASDIPHRGQPKRSHESPPHEPRDPPSHRQESPHIKALESHITTLREQLSGAEQRADRAEARLDQVLADLRNERAAIAEERRRLLERIVELEAQLAKESEPPGPDADAISEDLEHEGPPPVWIEEAWGAGASNDHSATADPAHQVERLWQRVEELEARLEAAKAERAGETATDQAPAPATTEAEGDAVPTSAEPEPTAERPRRWWWRVLRRR